jgi:hypothetical protein
MSVCELAETITHLPLLKYNLTVQSTHGLVVQPDAAVWVTTNCNFLLVNGEVRDRDRWFARFHDTQGAESSNMAGVHRVRG